MAKPRGLISQIFKNFLNTIKPKKLWGELIGKDQYGTEYYETKSLQGFSRTTRWYIPVSEEVPQKIPVEWEAWLRHKRRYPPTEEEIQYNLQKMRQTIENARRLEGSKTENKDEIKSIDKPKFPVYEDYENKP